MFSSQNFLLSVNPGDKIIKIRNVSGQLVHIIRDATCTIRQEGVLIYIKQQSESQVISLDFSSVDDCKAAHLLLRQELLKLGSSIAPPFQTQLEYSFNPTSNSTINVSFNITIPIVVSTCYAVYVNGVFISKEFYSTQIAISGIQTIFNWKDNAEYILETTDTIIIKYN